MLTKKVGFWLSEKKSKKLNFSNFQEACSEVGIELKQIDLDGDLERQGPFDLILHKLTDVIAKADQNDQPSLRVCQKFQHYIDSHPEIIIVDPFENVRLLLNRYEQYKIISKALSNFSDVDTPPFVVLRTRGRRDNLKKLNNAHIHFPFVCKPVEAHGSTQAHEMALVFNQKGLERDIRVPCVAQSFINHNATLYKIFVIGHEHFVVKRPSLKNFVAGDNDTIFFKSNDVSRADACSTLTELDEPVHDETTHELDPNLISKIVHRFRRVLNLSLFGIDMIRDNKTTKYHIIDINSFPGYDGVPDFFNVLLRHLTKLLGLENESAPSRCRVVKQTAAHHHIRSLSHAQMTHHRRCHGNGGLSVVATTQKKIYRSQQLDFGVIDSRYDTCPDPKHDCDNTTSTPSSDDPIRLSRDDSHVMFLDSSIVPRKHHVTFDRDRHILNQQLSSVTREPMRRDTSQGMMRPRNDHLPLHSNKVFSLA